MPYGAIPDMLVVLDEHPSSAGALAFAQRYAGRTLALASWVASTADLDAEVQTSISAQPSISEALRIAAQRTIGFVALRRDIAEPQQLLSELLVATAQHAHEIIPGFAVLLTDRADRPVRRILAIADQRSDAISGLSAQVAVSVAERTGAILDVLVLNGREPSSVASPTDLLAVNREQELFDRAVQRAKDQSVTVNWLPASDMVDPWLVIADQLGQEDYDLVIDDLGQVRLGGSRGVERTVQGALAPGEVGDLPLRLLTEVSVPLMLVIDEIRLGIAPAVVLKAGTVAALALGMIAPAAVVVTSARPVAAEGLDQGDRVTDLVSDLESALGVAEEDAAAAQEAERAADAEDSSRGGGDSPGRAEAQATADANATVASTGSGSTQVTQEADAEAEKQGAQAPTPPKPPKGGADPADVAKVRRDAEEAKAALAKDKKQQARAEETLSAAEEQFGAAQEQAEVALAELQAATEAQESAAVTATALRGTVAMEPTVLPPQPTPEQSQAAAAIEQSAQARVDAALAAGEEALTVLAEAQEQLQAAEEKLTTRTEDVAASKADYSQAKETVAVYKESLAKTRQAPVAKGSYRLTARFGQHGGYWSGGIHTGLDFAGSSGTDVRAAASGKVVSAGWEGAYGNQIVIDHGNGYQTTYNHLSRIGVSVGTKVSTGDHIGDMGSTGNSTGTHLHFEVTKDGKFMDPEEWLGW